MKKTTVLLLAAMLLTCCTSGSEVNAQTNDGQAAAQSGNCSRLLTG